MCFALVLLSELFLVVCLSAAQGINYVALCIQFSVLSLFLIVERVLPAIIVDELELQYLHCVALQVADDVRCEASAAPLAVALGTFSGVSLCAELFTMKCVTAN